MTFDCPRCGTTVDEVHYGPCGPCRTDLRASVRGTKRDVDVAGFEPAMHVTPNAVAVKE
jgi:hypothetical protein